MTRLLLTLLLAAPLLAYEPIEDCIVRTDPTWRPCVGHTNVAYRTAGLPDRRPGQFGLAEAVSNDITFHPPAGYRTRILELHGDQITDWVVFSTDSLLELLFNALQNGYAGALTSFQTTAPEGSARATPMADNTMVYHQVFVPDRSSFSRENIHNGRLDADNILKIVQAVFNNTAGRVVQFETTVTIVYQFEPTVEPSPHGSPAGSNTSADLVRRH